MLHNIVHATMIYKLWYQYAFLPDAGVIKQDVFFNGLNFGHVTIFAYLKI